MEKHGAIAKFPNQLRKYGFVVGAYVLIACCTGASFTADTPDYVASIVTQHGMWEFAHLLWRPLGWLVYHALNPLTKPLVGPDEFLNATAALMIFNWCGGLLCVVVAKALLGRICQSERATNFSVLALITSLGFLNYIHSGVAYITGLATLMLGMYLMSHLDAWPGRTHWVGAAAGALWTITVGMWLPFLLIIPAALLAPWLFGQAKTDARQAVGGAILAGGLLTMAFYGSAMGLLGIHDAPGLKSWIYDSSHGLVATAGLPRVVFGFARSFISMGNDGMMFKRFLLHDPYNPVSISDLLRASGLKLLLFYSCLLAMVVQLFKSSDGRRALTVFGVAALPMLLLAFAYQGGDMERYLPLYPFVFLAVAAQAASANKSVALVSIFAVVSAASNLNVLAIPRLAQRQQAVEGRIVALQKALKPGSTVYMLDHDDIYNFKRSFPFNPVNRGIELRAKGIVTLGSDRSKYWRQDFAAAVLDDWSHGRDVWISRRLLASHPLPEWDWAEGDDRNVAWREFPEFLGRLNMATPSAGADGFALIARSNQNVAVLRETSWLGGI